MSDQSFKSIVIRLSLLSLFSVLVGYFFTQYHFEQRKAKMIEEHNAKMADISNDLLLLLDQERQKIDARLKELGLDHLGPEPICTTPGDRAFIVDKQWACLPTNIPGQHYL